MYTIKILVPIITITKHVSISNLGYNTLSFMQNNLNYDY